MGMDITTEDELYGIMIGHVLDEPLVLAGTLFSPMCIFDGQTAQIGTNLNKYTGHSRKRTETDCPAIFGDNTPYSVLPTPYLGWN
jgi:hypothetical protein